VQDVRVRFRRPARRLGKPKALVAVTHTLLTVIYAVVRDGAPYQELGPDDVVPQDPERAARRHVAQLERLGHPEQQRGRGGRAAG
jgi:transposase